MYRREEGHWPGEPSPFFCSNEIVPLLRREHFCNKPRRIFRKKGSHFQNQPQRVVPVCWSSSHPQLSNPSSRPWTTSNFYLQIVCLGKSTKDFTFPILSLSKISILIWFSVPVLMYNSCSQIGSSVFLQTCTIFLFWKFSLFRLIGLIFSPWSHIADFHKWQQRRDRLFRWGPSSSNSLLWKTKWMIEAASLCVFSPMKNDLNSSAFHIVVKGKAVQPCGHFNSSKSYYKEFFLKENTKPETTLINSTPRRKPM